MNRIDALIEEEQCIDELGATLNLNPSHTNKQQRKI